MDKLPASVPKTIAPFLARAKELGSRDPVIAYWCKFKAAQLALDQMPSDPQGREYLENLIDDLEDTKAGLADNELVTDNAAGSAYVSNFAARVFEGADAVDREGKATRATAKEFLAASVFFEILSTFGSLDTDVSEKITYAKWKATSIAKAFREGRTPTPGPANAPAVSSATDEREQEAPMYHQENGNDSSEEVSRQLLGGEQPSAPSFDAFVTNDDEPSLPGVPQDAPAFSDLPPPSDYDLPSQSLPSAPPTAPSFTKQPSAPAASLSKTVPAKLPIPPPVEEEWQPAPASVDPTTIASAQKHAKWAISALNYEDLDTARKALRAALALIGG